ncbi:MAG: GNAT family N-acetyltransferase [Actinomycetota bacterium]|nr:GNAT family N-acetyltransferase [Actinomycetota bacterium]
MAIRARPYENEDDLRRMQALQQELWALEGPRVLTHAGDLAWWLHRGPEEDWRRRLWLDGDRCVAWAWLWPPASLDSEVHRDHRGGALHREVLAWFESSTDSDALGTYALESDDDCLAILGECGYTRPDPYTWYAYHVQDLDRERPEPVVPEGFTLRTVRNEADFHQRVAVHRAVWAPSRLTEESYRKVMRAWPYRSDLDCVVEAADGTFAAYVLCWYDDDNRVGEFEPVGTHPDYRRRGLGAAVCTYALRRLQEEGARQAIVYAEGRDEDEPSRALYESVGFHLHTRAIEFRKEREQ